MDEQKTLVSIIVRTKDRPKLLKRALQSIAGQTYRPIEVVLVNDGETIADLIPFEAMMPDISLRYLENNHRGRTAAANLGLTKSEGVFVGFLDDDDVFYHDHVSTLVYFLKSSDYRVAYTESYFVHSEYDPESRCIVQTQKYPAKTMDFSRETLLFYNYIPFMCLMFERSVLENVKGFDEKFDMCEDWDLTIRVSKNFPFQHISKITAEYHIWSRDFQSIQKNDHLLVYRRKIYQKHVNQFSPEMISAFIFNGYWANLKYLEDRIHTLDSVIAKKEEEIQEIQREKQGLEKESELLQAENERIEKEYSQLEGYVRGNTIKFPKRLKSILKSFLRG